MMTEEERKRKREEESEALVKKLIVFGAVVFVFLSILMGFYFLGFFKLLK